MKTLHHIYTPYTWLLKAVKSHVGDNEWINPQQPSTLLRDWAHKFVTTTFDEDTTPYIYTVSGKFRGGGAVKYKRVYSMKFGHKM